MDGVKVKDSEKRLSLNHVSHKVLSRRMSSASVNSAPSSISEIMYLTSDQSTPCGERISQLETLSSRKDMQTHAGSAWLITV